MKLNWAERWVVNNPTRVFQQHLEIKWLQQMMPLKAGTTVLEVGCGRGAGARLIQKAFLRGFLTGNIHLECLHQNTRTNHVGGV